ncbi:MAG: PorT family protein [Flavobacteriaceae bacterium]|nr:PorT family protein [Flavobacteriaceae bacterium]
MLRFILLFVFIIPFKIAAQDSIKSAKYLEDQLYVGFSYILLNKLVSGMKQNGFSNSLSLGFIKDLPVNEKRNFGFGAGLGYGRNTYYQNIFIEKVNGTDVFSLLEDGISFKTNKFSTHLIEIPLEIRWRTSTADRYKFYRIYAGGKLSYLAGSNARLRTSGSKIKVKGIDEINKLQFGLTLAVGYGTWNFNLYYGLTDIFKDAAFEDGTPLHVKDIRLGLIFYIL